MVHYETIKITTGPCSLEAAYGISITTSPLSFFGMATGFTFYYGVWHAAPAPATPFASA